MCRSGGIVICVVHQPSYPQRQMEQRMATLCAKTDGRLAWLAIFYGMGSSEDPEVAHKDFLYLVTGVARDIVYFGPKATPEQICHYLNDWRP